MSPSAIWVLEIHARYRDDYCNWWSLAYVGLRQGDEESIMYWITAIDIARRCEVTYEEWCNLYYNHKSPTEYQLRLCETTAHNILVRNGAIEEGVKFLDRPEVGRKAVV